jgi:hypothetical protein
MCSMRVVALFVNVLIVIYPFDLLQMIFQYPGI